MNNKALAAILSALEDTDSIRTVCPYCGGGASKESSFTATREGDSFFWKCFRASCGRGGQSGPGRVVRTTTPIRHRNTRLWEGECEQLSDEWRAFLQAKVGFTAWHVDVSGAMYAPKEHRIAYPIFDPTGRRRGWSLRSYNGETPKVLTFPERVDEPHLSYYRTRVGEGHVVVVEDIPSAVRASRYTNAVALLGTAVRFDDALEIAAHFRKVTWALDKDAIRLSLKWHNKYGGLFASSKIIMLEHDIKDLPDEELEVMLHE